ncbi:pyrroline-5-carboxylate reductase [bacterium]|nr:pyrroline-5-carboxylate reductase [bacterium]MBD3243149.1 pyrroline-5-carboxylate reductase [Chitinivibrionales bacterium]
MTGSGRSLSRGGVRTRKGMPVNVAVLGTGNMGSAFVRGLLKRYGADVTVLAWDQRKDAHRYLPSEVKWCAPKEWFEGDTVPRVVVVAVKPQDMASALQPLAALHAGKAEVLWCSIAAGVTIAALGQLLGDSRHICRVMPNTPALIGEGVSAYALNDACTDDDASVAEHVLGACGEVVRVQEKLMDAVTGLSGSGPAYVYLFIEALIEGGVSAGLPYDTARRLAVQTVRGAAGMVEQTGEAPSVLKSAVMSPGGTTVRGLMALEEHRVKYAIIRAVADATRRARELGS